MSGGGQRGPGNIDPDEAPWLGPPGEPDKLVPGATPVIQDCQTVMPAERQELVVEQVAGISPIKVVQRFLAGDKHMVIGHRALRPELGSRQGTAPSRRVPAAHSTRGNKIFFQALPHGIHLLLLTASPRN